MLFANSFKAPFTFSLLIRTLNVLDVLVMFVDVDVFRCPSDVCSVLRSFQAILYSLTFIQ